MYNLMFMVYCIGFVVICLVSGFFLGLGRGLLLFVLNCWGLNPRPHVCYVCEVCCLFCLRHQGYGKELKIWFEIRLWAWPVELGRLFKLSTFNFSIWRRIKLIAFWKIAAAIKVKFVNCSIIKQARNESQSLLRGCLGAPISTETLAKGFSFSTLQVVLTRSEQEPV